MGDLQQIMTSIQSLQPSEMLAVRAFLDKELKPKLSLNGSSRSLLGLLADEPELADVICESAMRDRESRPWRIDRG